MRNLVLSLMVLLFSCSACAANAKSLVIIFSRADENYTVGYIEKGNTMILAEMIAEKTNSELFEVKPAKKYPADYDTCIDVAKREQNQNARPAILEDKDISEYDTIPYGGEIFRCACTHLWKDTTGTGKKLFHSALTKAQDQDEQTEL